MGRRLENWIQAYLRYTDDTEAPTPFHFWTAISTLGGALRRKCYMDFGSYQWSPNFYIILVAPPGVVNKTTTLAIGHNLLREIPNISHGPSSVTWQKMADVIQESRQDFECKDGSLFPMSCVNFDVSELGVFLQTQDPQLISVLVDWWDGRQGIWEKGTKTSGDNRLVNPWVNIIAGTVPAWLKDNMSSIFVGSGFTSRCIFVVGTEKRKFVAYPKSFLLPEMQKLKEDLLNDLNEIANLEGTFKLTPDAEAWGEEWYKQFWGNPDIIRDNYAARMQCQIHKVAMALSVSTRSDLIITKDNLVAAHALMQAVAEQMPMITQAIETPAYMAVQKDLLITIGKGEIKDADLFRTVGHKVHYRNYREIISGLQAARYITVHNRPDGIWYCPESVGSA